MSVLPLSGVRMLCVEQLMALPFGTQLLADLGAEVIAVEPLDFAGDEAVPWRERTGRNKRRMSVNLKDPRGSELLRRMAGRFDVFAENFRPGVMARYGLDYDTLAQLNDRLIYVSVSGFGNDEIFQSPSSQMAAYGPIGEAMSGITQAILAGGGAGSLRLALGDVVSSIYATIGVLAALHHRNLTGKGQRVDVAMADSLLTIGELPVVAAQLASRSDRKKGGSLDYPVGSFETADGAFILIVLNETHWSRLCALLGREDWLSEPRFNDPATRGAAVREEAVPVLKAWAAARTKQQAASEAGAAGLAAAPVNGPEDVLDNEHFRSREMLRTLLTPDGGTLRTVGNPVKLSAVDGHSPAEPARLHASGEDTYSILGEELGLAGAELRELAENRIIAQTDRVR